MGVRTGIRLPAHPNATGNYPQFAETLRKHWADPEWRAALLAKRQARIDERKAKGEPVGAHGVPNGWRKPAWKHELARCRRKATWLMKKMVAAGIVEPITETEFVEVDGKRVEVPTTEGQMAARALKEAMVISLAPGERKDKLTALRMVLDFTKAKPAQKIDAKFSNAESFLDEVAAEVLSGAGK
jgi:hypothetical protein